MQNSKTNLFHSSINNFTQEKKNNLLTDIIDLDYLEILYREKFMLGKRPTISEKTDRDLMTIRTEYPYQTLKFWTAGSSEPALDLWNVYIPLDQKQRSNHTVGLMMIRRPSAKILLEIAWPFIVWFTNGIFAEDKWICELEQKAFDRQGEDKNKEIFPAIIQLRKVLINNGVPMKEMS